MIDYIKLYFALGLYTTEQLKIFVTAQMITADQFKEIANVDYSVD